MSDYDPKQVAMLDRHVLDEAVTGAEQAFAAAGDLDALQAARAAHVGDRAPVSLARREIGALPPAAKADAGKRVNQARAAIQAAYEARRAALVAERESRVLRDETVDVTLPTDRRPRGARHPSTTLMEHLGDLFVGMGYEVAEAPEVEVAWYDVDALDMDPAHPAGTVTDPVQLDVPGLVLRTPTSPAQLRTMLARTPPRYVVCPGRAYRTGELDAADTPVVHQVRGVGVDRGITMAHLKGTLDHVARAVFGAGAKTRLRPSHVAFTEPSARMDLWLRPAEGGPRWMEWGGCGMLHPRVLVACGIDPQEYSGFTFGLGIERTLMLRNGVADLRDMAEGDVRFSRAFGTEG